MTYLYFSIFLILIAFGSFTHLFIKYRFYLSLPFLSYKCIISILGFSLFISYLMIFLREKLPNRFLYFLLVIGLWLIIIFSGFTRPSLNSHMGQISFIYYPNPLEELKIILKGFL